MYKHMGVEMPDKYYGHVPDKVIILSEMTIMWVVPIITVQKILATD